MKEFYFTAKRKNRFHAATTLANPKSANRQFLNRILLSEKHSEKPELAQLNNTNRIITLNTLKHGFCRFKNKEGD